MMTSQQIITWSLRVAADVRVAIVAGDWSLQVLAGGLKDKWRKRKRRKVERGGGGGGRRWEEENEEKEKEEKKD